jgi:hypothetical protein
MAEELRHIEHIDDTDANLQTNLDVLQTGIQTDGDENLVYKDDDGTYHKVANENEAATFTVITATDDINMAATKRIGLADDTANISFPDTATVQVNNADLVVDTGGALFVDDTNLVVNAPGYENKVGIGTAEASHKLHVSNPDSGSSALFADSGGSVQLASGGFSRYDGDADNIVLHINYSGYSGGLTRYRDTYIDDGKGNAVLVVDGSAGSVKANGKLETGGTLCLSGVQEVSVDNLGEELVVNGHFSSGTNWTINGDVVISGGVATFGTSGSGDLEQTTGCVVEVGETYRLEVYFDSKSGDNSQVIVSDGSTPIYLNGDISTDGLLYADIVATTTTMKIVISYGLAVISHVSLKKKTTSDDVTPTHGVINVTNDTPGGEPPGENIAINLLSGSLSEGTHLLIHSVGTHYKYLTIYGANGVGGEPMRSYLGAGESCLFFKSVDGWSPIRDTQPPA